MCLTEKQREYIESMLTNRFTDEKDQQSLRRHLKNTGKQDFTQLSKPEASALIKDLLHRDVEYELVCGKRMKGRKLTFEERVIWKENTKKEILRILDGGACSYRLLRS